jgi:CRISPR-associated exonuclease Cas4
MMISENYGVEVDRGFICYTRSNKVVKQVDFKKEDFDRAIAIIMDIPEIIKKCFYPDRTKDKVKCVDCCYRNICV